MRKLHIDSDQLDGYTADVTEDYVLDAGVLIWNDQHYRSLVVTPEAFNASFEVRGRIYGSGTDAAVTIDAVESLFIVATSGIVTGVEAIAATALGSVDIVNHGYVEGRDAGIVFNALSGTITNDGLIASRGYAITTEGGDLTTLTIENNGRIVGTNGIYGDSGDLVIHLGAKSRIDVYQDAIAFDDTYPPSGNSVTVVNAGEISAVRAFYGGWAQTHFTNKGTIHGDVVLSQQDDVYVEKGRLDGTLDGSGGDDTFIVNSSKTRIAENTSGGGTDTVKSSVTYALAKSTVGVEDLTLIGKKDVNATGDDGRNALMGNLGDNRIDGGAGRDLLTGGKGDDFIDGGSDEDQLTGGTGDDIFVFRHGSGLDTITDFQQGHDRIELVGADIRTFKDISIFESLGRVLIDYTTDTENLNRIIIENASAADFDRHDFVFA